MIIETGLSSSGQKITLANFAGTKINQMACTSGSIRQHSLNAWRSQDCLRLVQTDNCAARKHRLRLMAKQIWDECNTPTLVPIVGLPAEFNAGRQDVL